MDKALRRVAIILTFLFGMSACWWAGRMFGRREGLPPSPKRDTVCVVSWVHDTIKEEPSRPAGSIATILAVHDTVMVHERDTVTVVDSVLVDVPIEEKAFAGENYRAVVRGFRPELADIWVRKETETIKVQVWKHWNVTAGPQLGVGITPDGWRPYAGVGVTFGYSF